MLKAATNWLLRERQAGPWLDRWIENAGDAVKTIAFWVAALVVAAYFGPTLVTGVKDLAHAVAALAAQ